jgi:hypothetical protein
MRTPTAPVMSSLAVLLASLAACSDTSGPAAAGSLEVNTTTSGAPPDPSTYSIRLDHTVRQPIAAAGRATLTGLAPGPHTLELLDVPPACLVTDANPRVIEVASATTTQVLFAVSCHPPTGALRVITATIGAQLDPDGYVVSVEGAAPRPIGIADTIVFQDLPLGDTRVTLGGIAPNCAPTGGSQRTASVAVGLPAAVLITVTCAPVGVAGSVIQVAVATTLVNAGSPLTYHVSLDGTRTIAVPDNGTASFAGVSVGEHWVYLSVPSYCAVGGFRPARNPARVVVPGVGVQTVRFWVLCIG